ncbi:MAG: efflux RND transporter periplasmic adaptor subunit [Bacteroidota bacterium]
MTASSTALPPRRSLLGLAGAALLLLAAGGTFGWLTFQAAQPSAPAVAPTAPVTGEAGSLAAYDLNGDGLVYQSGMHPWIVQDAPGSCPVCGMDLQPVAVDGGEAGTVQIDPVVQQNMGVRTAPVERRAIQRTLRTTGTFADNARTRRAVSPKVSGWVERLDVDAVGDRVEAGTPLLALYSPELVASQEEYLLALRNRALLGEEDGLRLVEAARRRLALFDISDEQLDRLEATGLVQRTLTLHSPSRGTVLALHAVEGARISAGQTLFELADLSQLWLQVDVPEQELGWVRPGLAVTVQLDHQPGPSLTGRVDYVYDTIDPATRTGTARVVVANRGRRLKPGMYATATLQSAPSPVHPTVPTEAVIRTGDEAVVLLAEGDGRFRPQTVTLGPEGDGLVQVLAGLTGDEVVVTSAQFLIDSEARLADALSALASPPAPASMDDESPLMEMERQP